jgi:hypothetical protein
LLGPDEVPVNIDADRAFAVEEPTFSRFLKYKPVLPNARTFLYADYVQGRIDLPFHLLAKEARRIHMLHGDDVRAVLRAYADTRFEDGDEAERFVESAMERRRSMEVDVARFIRDLHLERARSAREPRTWTERTERASARAWDEWQVMLQRMVRGAPGRAARSVLRMVRGRAV